MSDPKLIPGQLKLPVSARSPWWELARRLLLAVAILVFTVLLVYFDRDGYRDNADPTTTTGRPRRRDLLHDGHAQHHRLRRHRAGRSRTPG